MKKIRLFVEEKVKRMLRKWLKKRIYTERFTFETNNSRFNFVYDAPIHEWRDRIWCLENSLDITDPGLLLKLYLYF